MILINVLFAVFIIIYMIYIVSGKVLSSWVVDNYSFILILFLLFIIMPMQFKRRKPKEMPDTFVRENIQRNICPECGADLESNTLNFCPRCGRNMKEREERMKNNLP